MKSTKVTLLTSIGSLLEYYDLIIYSLLANFISRQFFSGDDPVAALFATFGVLAAGNILRPLGGIVFGLIGDRCGRIRVFSHALLWMAFATLVMGVTPSCATIGKWAAVIFGGCRIIQSLAFGAEFPGALTILSEHIHDRQQGRHLGFMIASVSLGASLGSLVIWMLTQLLTESQLQSWGFRIPFILGGGLAVVGFYIRKHLPESPKFTQAAPKVRLTPPLIRSHLRSIVTVMGISLFPVCLSSFKLIFPVFLREFYHFSLTEVYWATTLGYTWSALMKWFFGWLSDQVGRKPLLIGGSLAMIVGGIPIFAALQSATVGSLLLFTFFSQTITASTAASYFVLLPQAFQTKIRYTGIGFSHNIVHVIAAGTPLVVNYIYGVAGNPTYLVGIFILLASLTIFSTWVFQSQPD